MEIGLKMEKQYSGHWPTDFHSNKSNSRTFYQSGYL